MEPRKDTDRASDEGTVVDLSEDDPGLDVLRVRTQVPRGKSDKEKKRVAFDTVTSTPKAKTRMDTNPGTRSTHSTGESRDVAGNADRLVRIGPGEAQGVEVEMSRVTVPGPVDALGRDLNEIKAIVENAAQHQRNVEDEHQRTVTTLLRELQRMEQENEALKKEYDERIEEGNDQWKAMLERRLKEYESNIRQTA